MRKEIVNISKDLLFLQDFCNAKGAGFEQAKLDISASAVALLCSKGDKY